MPNIGAQVEVLNLAGEHQFYVYRARDVRIQGEHNSAGAVLFEVDARTANAQPLLAVREGLVRASIEGVPNPIWGVLDETSFNLEDGPDKPITVSCPGTLSLLEEGILYPPAQVAAKVDENWRWWYEKSPGQVILEALNEIKARGGLANITPSFSIANDSRGRPWSGNISRKWKAGTSLFELIEQLAIQGIVIVRMNGLTLDVFDYAKEKAVLAGDKLALTRLWYSQAPNDISRVGGANVIVAEGEGGLMSTSSVNDGLRRREKHVGIGSVTTQAELDSLAAEALARTIGERESYNVTYSMGPGRPIPWVDFEQGAVVERIEPFLSSSGEDLIVRSVNVSVNHTGGVAEVALEIGDRNISRYRADDNDGSSMFPDTPFPGVLPPQEWQGWSDINTETPPPIPDFPPAIFETPQGTIDMNIPPTLWEGVPPGGWLEFSTGDSPDLDDGTWRFASTSGSPGSKVDLSTTDQYNPNTQVGTTPPGGSSAPNTQTIVANECADTCSCRTEGGDCGENCPCNTAATEYTDTRVAELQESIQYAQESVPRRLFHETRLLGTKIGNYGTDGPKFTSSSYTYFPMLVVPIPRVKGKRIDIELDPMALGASFSGSPINVGLQVQFIWWETDYPDSLYPNNEWTVESGVFRYLRTGGNGQADGQYGGLNLDTTTYSSRYGLTDADPEVPGLADTARLVFGARVLNGTTNLNLLSQVTASINTANNTGMIRFYSAEFPPSLPGMLRS